MQPDHLTNILVSLITTRILVFCPVPYQFVICWYRCLCLRWSSLKVLVTPAVPTKRPGADRSRPRNNNIYVRLLGGYVSEGLQCYRVVYSDFCSRIRCRWTWGLNPPPPAQVMFFTPAVLFLCVARRKHSRTQSFSLKCSWIGNKKRPVALQLFCPASVPWCFVQPCVLYQVSCILRLILRFLIVQLQNSENFGYALCAVDLNNDK